jgi:hypothetical protein
MPRELAEYGPKSKEELPMALKMTAAVVEQFEKPLTLRQRDIPNSLSFLVTKPSGWSPPVDQGDVEKLRA